MWTRAELKDRAKAAMAQGYWKLVLVGLIATAIGSGGSSSSIEFKSEENISPDIFTTFLAMLPAIIGIASIGIIIAVLISIFVINPIEIGTSRFFLKSLTEDTEIREVLFAFDYGYKNVVKILFIRNLKIFLWSLLFIIPGIVKGYEYRMISYLLAENPELTEEEAFRLSRQMMDGQKWEAFVLDWSFFGWDLLVAITMGIVGIFYVNPYVCLTNAALYDTLSANHGHPARATASQREWNNTYTQTGYVEILMGYTILVADDEKEIRELLRLYLENTGYSVIEAEDGQQALDILRNEKIDLCLLDIMMPKVDGYRVLQELRKESNIPVMILSAKDADSEKILGLNLGADDYMTKPFNPLEAIARVNSNIRRFYSLGTSPTTETIKVKDLELDVDACEFRKNGEVIELTSVEYKIMELFMKSPGKVFTKQQIYEYGWGEDFVVADNNIMVCISKLRDKLDEDPSAYIKTIRGLGYRLER